MRVGTSLTISPGCTFLQDYLGDYRLDLIANLSPTFSRRFTLCVCATTRPRSDNTLYGLQCEKLYVLLYVLVFLRYIHLISLMC